MGVRLAAAWALMVLNLAACYQPLRDVTFRARVATVSTVGGAGLYGQPLGVAVDASGTVYVATFSGNTILKFAPGATSPTTVAGTGSTTPANQDSTNPLAATFNNPRGVAVNGSGTIIDVADETDQTIRTITSAGVSTLAGTVENANSPPFFDNPVAIARTSSGILYVADSQNFAIRKIESGTVTVLAGDPAMPGSSDSPAEFSGPSGLTVDASGNVYVTDSSTPTTASNNLIRKISPDGTVTTIAGIAGPSGSGFNDSTDPHQATFNLPSGIAVDGSGNIYIADSGNNVIRMIAPSGAVTTIAGSATEPGGSADGPGPLARFNGPASLAIDSSGNLYVADLNNASIRKITFGPAQL